MADPITRAQIQSWPVCSYAQIRTELVSGDLLFASGNYLFSRLIRHITHSAWSHVGIIYREPKLNRLLLLESVETFGVRFAPLSKYLVNYRDGKPYDGEIAVARIRGLDPMHVEAAISHGLDQLTDPYDRGEVYRILWRVLLGRIAPQPRREHAFICSELVHECFASAGLKLGEMARGYICPGDLWSDPRVELRFRLARETMAAGEGQ